MTFKPYWAATCTLAGGLSLISNLRRYPSRSAVWIAGKSLLDLSLLLVLFSLLPALIVVYVTLFILDRVNETWELDRVWRITITIVTGLLVSKLAAVCFELVFLIGAVAMNVITGKAFENPRDLFKRRFA
jgi:hypothetical protein